MPFGLTNAPALFQRFINEALEEILDVFVIAYLDDILIFSHNLKEHVQHVQAVLEKLQKAETTEHQSTFDKAKEAITTTPILAQHNPAKQTIIKTDASDYAIGARMVQAGPDRKLRPIAFESRKLVQAELNYNIHNKELLAIVSAFKK
ncbi:unnamed protein product [Aspergillus oryzae]|nr:unnamed protein product [Aspergillus oryzae]GMF97428.1 unnamed protein product [Aspergillus oryzae]